MNQRVLRSAAACMLALTSHAFAQQTAAVADNAPTGSRPAAAQAPPAGPTPRRADGKPLLGTKPGEAALWLPAGGGGEHFTNPDNAEPVPGKLQVSDVPWQPWSRAIFEYRQSNQLEPHTRCKPSGGPREFLTPYGLEIVELADLQQVILMDLGGPHTYRRIYLDGRPHPKEMAPSYYGHSTGKWEGDTLVVETVGFNEKFWMDRQGTPHTDKLKMIEKFTRTDSNTIKYEVTIDDPGAYTRPWTSGFNLRWTANSELFEYVCQDNNFASDLMVGTQEFVDRTSKIVP